MRSSQRICACSWTRVFSGETGWPVVFAMTRFALALFCVMLLCTHAFTLLMRHSPQQLHAQTYNMQYTHIQLPQFVGWGTETYAPCCLVAIQRAQRSDQLSHTGGWAAVRRRPCALSSGRQAQERACCGGGDARGENLAEQAGWKACSNGSIVGGLFGCSCYT